MIISSYFLQRKIKALAVSLKGRKIFYPSWEKAASVLVAYLYKDKATIEPCIARLKSMDKKVMRLVFVDNVKEDVPQESQSVFIKREKLNVWGIPDKELLQAASALKADMLIDLSSACCLPLIYAELLNPSLLKVGPKWGEGMTFYDFTIDVPRTEGAFALLEQVIVYARRFGK